MTTNLTRTQLQEWDNNDLIDQIIMLQNELNNYAAISIKKSSLEPLLPMYPWMNLNKF
tara:strand:+ start:1046 stop:1219 length:174 start_codon:yes stop_codon:yes gene_type:complete